MRNKNKYLIILFLFQTNYFFPLVKNNKPQFVVIIPSYNNKNWYERNLNSVLNQDYKRYRVVYIDDCSPDGTGKLVEQYITSHNADDKITLIKNTKRKGALANLYCAIHSCDDSEIIVTLDGDDWFAHKHVFSILARAYCNSSIWLTYGQYMDLWGGIGCCRKIESQIIEQNLYREKPNTASHLRTFYAWLFKAIKLEDLLYHGVFFPMTWDWAMMYPMLEMSGGRFKFIPSILYIYNTENPLNDSKIDEPFQIYLSKFIQQKKPYQPLEKPIIAETNKSTSCSLIVLADNGSLQTQQIIQKLSKQQTIISSVKVVNKKNCYQALKKFVVQPELTEFVIIVTQDYLTFFGEKLDEALSLLRQTQASVCTFMTTKNISTKKIEQERSGKSLEQKLQKNKRQIKFDQAHCSPLSTTSYIYQLGWEPDIFMPYQERAYVFSLHFLQEYIEHLPDLLDNQCKLNKKFKQKVAHCVGLLMS